MVDSIIMFQVSYAAQLVELLFLVKKGIDIVLCFWFRDFGRLKEHNKCYKHCVIYAQLYQQHFKVDNVLLFELFL